jgi:uncharacterized protein YneF (UPF0154 family)
MTKMTSSGNTYFPNYVSTPNFSASFDNKYISGVCREMTFSTPKHKFNFSHSAELVIKHIKSDNDIFYVVIPLIFSTDKTSQLDALLELKNKSAELNSDLKKLKSSIICYQIKDGSSANAYVFVFEKPISIKSKISRMDKFNAFNGQKNAIRIQNGENIEDEIECEYVTTSDETTSVENQRMVTKIFVWVFIVLGLFLSALYVFTYISKNPNLDVETVQNIYLGIGVVSFTLLMVYINLFINTTTKRIEYGFMTVFSILVMLLTILALTGRFTGI